MFLRFDNYRSYKACQTNNSIHSITQRLFFTTLKQDLQAAQEIKDFQIAFSQNKLHIRQKVYRTGLIYAKIYDIFWRTVFIVLIFYLLFLWWHRGANSDCDRVFPCNYYQNYYLGRCLLNKLFSWIDTANYCRAAPCSFVEWLLFSFCCPYTACILWSKTTLSHKAWWAVSVPLLRCLLSSSSLYSHILFRCALNGKCLVIRPGIILGRFLFCWIFSLVIFLNSHLMEAFSDCSRLYFPSIIYVFHWSFLFWFCISTFGIHRTGSESKYRVDIPCLNTLISFLISGDSCVPWNLL